jgi:hypothetical protein
MAMQSLVESTGEVATICAETRPGPSLTNEKVRADPAESAAESSISPLNAIVAVGEVWVGIVPDMGSAVRSALEADRDGAPTGEVSGLAPAPDRSTAAVEFPDARGVEPLEFEPFGKGDALLETRISATASPNVTARLTHRRRPAPS